MKRKGNLDSQMGCLKLIYDYQEQGEKTELLTWRVWSKEKRIFWEVERGEQTQGDPNLQRILQMANDNFFHASNNQLNWIIDYDGKGGTKSYSPGATEALSVSKKINVYIHPSVLNSPQKLFLTMGHEFVHVLDHDSGLFRSLAFKYGGENAYNILEYRAYTWSTAVDQALGLGMGQAGMLDHYRGLLPNDYLGR